MRSLDELLEERGALLHLLTDCQDFDQKIRLRDSLNHNNYELENYKRLQLEAMRNGAIKDAIERMQEQGEIDICEFLLELQSWRARYKRC